MPEVNDKILVKVAGEYVWAKISRIVRDVYTIPVYVATVLNGPAASTSVATFGYLEFAKSGSFISHDLPAACNA